MCNIIANSFRKDLFNLQEKAVKYNEPFINRIGQLQSIEHEAGIL